MRASAWTLDPPRLSPGVGDNGPSGFTLVKVAAQLDTRLGPT